MHLDPIKWKKKFSTGNASVDFQHQYFAELINRIADNLLEAQDVEHRKRLLDELVKYGKFHFTSEENIAFALGLKGLAKHHERHIELLEELNQHVDDLLAEKFTTEDFVKFLCHWFVGHTVHEDTSLFFEREV